MLLVEPLEGAVGGNPLMTSGESEVRQEHAVIAVLFMGLVFIWSVFRLTSKQTHWLLACFE